MTRGVRRLTSRTGGMMLRKALSNASVRHRHNLDSLYHLPECLDADRVAGASERPIGLNSNRTSGIWGYAGRMWG